MDAGFYKEEPYPALRQISYNAENIKNWELMVLGLLVRLGFFLVVGGVLLAIYTETGFCLGWLSSDGGMSMDG